MLRVAVLGVRRIQMLRDDLGTRLGESKGVLKAQEAGRAREHIESDKYDRF